MPPPQSKTQVERDARGPDALGTQKGSLAVARGQALAVNGVQCFTKDCAEPVAKVGGGTEAACSSAGDLQNLPQQPTADHRALPTCSPAPARPQVTTSVVPGSATAGPKVSATAVARGDKLSATRVSRGGCGVCAWREGLPSKG